MTTTPAAKKTTAQTAKERGAKAPADKAPKVEKEVTILPEEIDGWETLIPAEDLGPAQMIHLIEGAKSLHVMGITENMTADQLTTVNMRPLAYFIEEMEARFVTDVPAFRAACGGGMAGALHGVKLAMAYAGVLGKSGRSES